MFRRTLKTTLSGRTAVVNGIGLRTGGLKWVQTRFASGGSTTEAGEGTDADTSTGTSGVNYFKMFPQTFPTGKEVPGYGFLVDVKKLRKEYRKLQSVSHPDLNNILNKAGGASEGSDGVASSLINKAYETLSDPLKRAQYILLMQAGIDLSNDEVGKSLQFQDKAMLFEMMEIHERLESIMNERELEDMKKENQSKIKELCETLTELFEAKEWDKAALATIRLKYCYNIKNALKEWEAGKPVTLTH